ncbi:hypothetical protein CRUP_017017 [Coryphaenoides rupestris]|nr:hypothetical protein CRUP_017017 [Coryphaenoides rupestris]
MGKRASEAWLVVAAVGAAVVAREGDSSPPTVSLRKSANRFDLVNTDIAILPFRVLLLLLPTTRGSTATWVQEPLFKHIKGPPPSP